MTVKQVLAKAIKDGGYNGLYDDDCACDITDLVPCCCSNLYDCKLGYYQKLTAQQIEDDIDFIIGPEKVKI